MKKQDFEKLRDRVDRMTAAIVSLKPADPDTIPELALAIVEAIDKALAAAGYIADDAAADARLARWPHCYNCRTRVRVGCSAAFSDRSAGRCPFDGDAADEPPGMIVPTWDGAPIVTADDLRQIAAKHADQAEGLRRLAARASGAGE